MNSKRLLHVFVEVHADEHAQDADDVDLDTESQRELHQDKVNGERGVDAGAKVCGEDALNRALGRHDMENFSKNAAQQSADNDEDEQNRW